MKGNGRRNVWLALAAVVAACLVLAGCPHNGLLEGGGGGGLANGGGGRGGGDGVQLVITNFVADGAASRSASWLGGPQKTITPGHIDLKGNTDAYVFIVSGTGGGSYGPKFVDIAQNTGIASLDISGGGIWEITVDAYAVDKINAGQGGVTGTDKATIMAAPDNAAKIVALADTAKVLTGRATVDLGGGSQVTMTLSNDGVGTQGTVNVDIYFDTQFDKDKIRDESYKVSVSLYDFLTGDVVQGGGQSSKQEVHNGVGDVGNPEVYNVDDVAKGRYQFRLEVSDAADKVVAYYVDDIYVEGNRTTDYDVHISNLFNAPTAPTDLKVYWSKRDDADLKDGFLAAIQWDGVSYNAVGMNIEIADITKYYSYAATNHKVNFNAFGGNADLNLADTSTLWGEIDRVSDIYNAVVTRLSWSDSPQKATKYPVIWKSGSLLNGSNGVTFLMQTGHVYSVRISAAGAQTDSTWVNFGDLAGAATAPGVGAYQEFTALKNQGLFDLVEVTYDLEGKYFLYKTGAGNLIGNKATKDELVVYQEYNPQAAYMVDKKFADITQTPEGDWFLYPQVTTGGTAPANVTDRIMTWIGWQNKNDFNDSYLVTNAWKAAGYTGYSNLHLVTVGAGGSVTVQAETSGTFNVLDDTKVLVSIEADNAPTAANATWAELQNGDSNPAGAGAGTVKTTKLALEKDTTRYILNLNRGGATPTVLYVAAGDSTTPGDIGTLTDSNGNKFTVRDIQVSLKQGLTERVTFSVKVDGPVAYYPMDGVASGDYTLWVKILADSGYWQTYQVPIVVKYDDQTITP